MSGHDHFRVQPDDVIESLQPPRVGARAAHGSAVPEDHVAREQDALPGHVNDRVAGLSTRPDVDQVHLGSVEVEHEPVLEERRRRHRRDAAEIVVPLELPGGGEGARMESSEPEAREQATRIVEQLLDRTQVGGLLHATGHRSMRDDLGALEQLVPPHVAPVRAGVDDAPRHARPDPAEQLDHPARVRQVRLAQDDGELPPETLTTTAWDNLKARLGGKPR